MLKESKSTDGLPNLYGKLTTLIWKNMQRADDPRQRLAHLTEIAYENGKRNPNAQTRKLFMNEKQANLRGCSTNPPVAGRLAQSDATLTTDGAAVVILASEEFKQKHCPDRALPVVKGRGFRVAPMELKTKLTEARVSDYLLPWTHKTVEEAYKSAGLTADDIDVFELYDYYTAGELIELSCVGLCKPGEEYRLIEDGVIAFDGAKPVNPTGGLIGGGHPQSATGVRMFLDLYKQLTGTAGGCQVPNQVKNGLMLNMGGSATSNYVHPRDGVIHPSILSPLFSQAASHTSDAARIPGFCEPGNFFVKNLPEIVFFAEECYNNRITRAFCRFISLPL